MAEDFLQGGVWWWQNELMMMEIKTVRSSDEYEGSSYEYDQELLRSENFLLENKFAEDSSIDTLNQSLLKYSISSSRSAECATTSPPMNSHSYSSSLQLQLQTDSQSYHTAINDSSSAANTNHHHLNSHGFLPTPSCKRPRIETPSPLPTFKVRKEKMGDRITALQQLVSPFGKTDTASVLNEAIQYIKFLHHQVNALSTPYGSHPDKSKDQERLKKDLKTQGLCLSPISSTFPVASETTTDFWTPTFCGSF